MEIERPKTLTEQAYDAIVRAIMNDEILPGESYSEQWFAEKLGISRTPVREALAQLRDEEMLENIGIRGLRVKPMTREDAYFVYEARKSLEGYCIFKLAGALAEGDPAAQQTLEIMNDSMRDAEDINYVELDHIFHQAPVKFTRNPRIIRAYDKMLVRAELYWKTSNSLPENRRESWKQHEAVLEILRAGDPAKAYDAMLSHLDFGYEAVCLELSD